MSSTMCWHHTAEGRMQQHFITLSLTHWSFPPEEMLFLPSQTLLLMLKIKCGGEIFVVTPNSA